MTSMTSPVPAIDTSNLAHVSIRASAGSGKTFQLTNRYLQLIAAGAAPSSILATTFTRLAAGQIRDRILLRLARAADEAAERRELAKHLGAASLSRRDIVSLLTLLTRNLHQMQIRTLDSFFASVVRSFAIELDVPLGAEVVDEAQARQMRDDAVRRMLDEQNPQELVDLLRLLTQGSSQRSVMDTIDQVVTDLYALYCETDPQAWECVPELPGKLTMPRLVQAIQRLENAPCGSDGRHVRAHQADCARARQWDWEAFISTGMARIIAQGGDTYYNKPIHPDLIAAYMPLVAHARAELVGRVRDQTIATHQLLHLFHQHYEAVKRAQRSITFADLTAAMSRARQLGQLEEISFRLDAQLQHLLLDEFQDTSIAQWRALEPIALELVSYAPPQRTFFCVGDVKQSIYGWRQAAPEVFDELPRLLAGSDGSIAIRQQQLACSYRSSPIIMDVVNQVFESIDQNPALADFQDAARAWQAGFATHNTARTKLPGYAELRVCRRALEDEDKVEIRFAAAADLVAQLHCEQPAMRIAVLTRSNKAVAQMLYELGPSRRSIPVSGRGGGPLCDAPAVNAMLDLLQLADHPDDTVAAFNVACSPLGAAVGLTEFNNRPQRHRIAREVRRRLLDVGYCQTLAEWTSAIAGACDARELRRVLQLVELAGRHDEYASLRTSHFIELVETTAVADIQPAPVQVMTIHQAKGLEFDAVVLPELEGQLTGEKSPPVVFDRVGETGPIQRVCRYMNKDTLALVPELQPLFERDRRRTVRESLSLLYVAITRAIHGLYMFIDPPAERERAIPKKISGVLRCALIDGEPEPDSVAYAHGDPKWTKHAKFKPLPTISEAAPITAITFAPDSSAQAASRGISADAASTAVTKKRNGKSIAPYLKLPAVEARERGTALHALFQHLRWLDQHELADDAALLNIALAAAPRRGESWASEQVQAFRRMLQQPQVRAVFTREDSDKDRTRLYCELPFARTVNGSVQTGFIDRLVMRCDPNGVVELATVIDIKTDSITADEAVQHAEHYRPQLETYRDAVAELFKLDHQQIEMMLLFVVPDIAVTL